MSIQAPTESVRVQVEALRRKLLDLSMRNRMLNYKPSRRLGITVLGEDGFLLHRLIVENGKKMSFVGKPDPPKTLKTRSGNLAPDDDVAMAAFREAAEDELNAYLGNAAMPVDVLDTKLNIDDYESVLQAKLRMIAREASLANDELGINTLFLTLGNLEWSESDERSYRAPLIFVPVKLEKQNNGSVKLVHDGSDVGTNLPLRAKLNELNLKLPELEEDKDLLDYYSEVESTVKNRENWQVHRDEICLGFFNYEKYAMYVDLGGDAWPEGRKPWQDADLVAMLGGGYSSPESPIGDETQLDSVRTVKESHEVFDADSSQTIAMIRAAAGLSIVVEGPPGTGKSQTITNIIAEAVAAGKTVLFVSAKRAALEVVKRNLERADLGAMCLDLHDKLTNRKEFYSEIKKTVSRALSLKADEAKVTRLTELRDKLNAHSAAVNEPLEAYGIPPFTAMSILAGLPKELPEDREGRIAFETLSKWKEAEIRAALPLVEAVQKRMESLGTPAGHPYWGTAIDYIDPSRKLDLEQDLGQALSSFSEAEAAMVTAAAAMKIEAPQTAESLRILRLCAEQAQTAPLHDGVAVKTASWKTEEVRIREVIAALNLRREIKTSRSAQVKSEVWSADLLSIESAYDRYASRWYKFIIGAYRKARQQFEIYVTPNAGKDAASRHALIADVRRVQSAEGLIADRNDLMHRLLGVQWQDLDTDPEVVHGLLEWILGLDDKISKGELPSGLLDFLDGSHDNAALAPLVEAAEKACNLAIEHYRTVAELLKYPHEEVRKELWKALTDRLNGWRDNLGKLPGYIGYNEARRQLLDRGFSTTVDVADRWPLAARRLRDTFVRSYYSGVVREAMQSRPELRTFEREGHEAGIEEFRSLDDFKLKYNRAQVRLAHQRQLPSFDNALGNLHVLKMQCELQRKHKPIRWIMGRAGEAIQKIKPVFMMSPLSAAIHLPPELPSFDMVIFDEASQIKPEDSLCAIVRAKQAIVVGDTRQMPPTSFFDRLSDDEDLEDDSDEAEIGNEARKLESVLSLMSAVTMGQVRRPDLRWHYRSIHPTLIQPSNEMFYDNRLVVFPSPGQHQGGRQIGVVFHHLTDTVYEPGAMNRINRREAEIVADAVIEQVTKQPEESLLVAAMNKPQADLIYAEVQKRERLRPDAFQAYNQSHPHEHFDVKNLENVQGDERDVIFISVTYGRDAEGVLRQNFGPLLLDGGERRLNVLITRARRRCEVFSNLTANDIRLEKPRAGVQALKRYLKFAESGVIDVATPSGLGEESPFEEEVSAALRSRGYAVDTQIGSEGYRIDLGVVDPNMPGSYVLGIECDGATYHQARSARDRDKLRQRVLETRGWRLHRIWSHDWWQDRDGEIQRLVAAIENAEELADPATELEEEIADPIIVESVSEATVSRAGLPYVATEKPDPPLHDHQLGDYMRLVIQTEGPIHRDLLAIRLREAAGHDRGGPAIKARMDRVMATNLASCRFTIDAFYEDDKQLTRTRDWSTRPTAERKFEMISVVEITAALKSVVGTAFGISPESATKAASNLLGFKRPTETATARCSGVLAKMVESGELEKQPDGLLCLAR